MDKKAIRSRHLPNMGFPWALHVTEIKEWIFISGIPPMDRSGKIVGKGDVLAQFEYEVEMMEGILSDAGMALSDIVYLTLTVTEKVDLYSSWDSLLEMYLSYFPNLPGPAAGCLRVVNSLSHPDMLVEVEAIAGK